MASTRTDLAMEAFDGQGGDALSGVRINRWNTGDIEMTEVVISVDGVPG